MPVMPDAPMERNKPKRPPPAELRGPDGPDGPGGGV